MGSLIGSSSRKTTNLNDHSISLQNGGTVHNVEEGASLSYTDGGAIDGAVSLAGAVSLESIESNEKILTEALRVSRDSANLAGEAAKQAAEFVERANERATKAANEANERALRAAKEAASDALRSANNAAESALDSVSRASSQAFAFGEGALDSVKDNSSEVMDFARDTLSDVSDSNKSVVSTVKSLAENLKAGEVSETSGKDTAILYISIAGVVGFVLIFLVVGFKK